MVESAVGLMNLKDVILQASSLARSEKLFTLEGVVFGSDDFCADIGKALTFVVGLQSLTPYLCSISM